MICTLLMFSFLAVAAYTDVRWRVVTNSTTYSGILVALLGSAVGSGATSANVWQESFAVDVWGFVPIGASVGGLLACGVVMLISYVVLAGGVGGGDVKLLTMMGAFLGVNAGLEAMLWTLVLGGCLALLVLIWSEGFLSLVGKSWRYMRAAAKSGAPPTLDDKDKQALKVELFLSPSALLGAAIVRFQWVEWF